MTLSVSCSTENREIYLSGSLKGLALHPHPLLYPPIKEKSSNVKPTSRAATRITLEDRGLVNVTFNTYFLVALNKIPLVSCPDLKSIQSSEHSNPQVNENWVKDFMLPVCVLKEASLFVFIDCLHCYSSGRTC